MNEQNLFGALEHVRDEYLLESETVCKRRSPLRKALLLAGAAALLCVTAIAAPYLYSALTGGTAQHTQKGLVDVQSKDLFYRPGLYQVQLELSPDPQPPEALETHYLPQVPQSWATEYGYFEEGIAGYGSQQMIFAWDTGKTDQYVVFRQMTLDLYEQADQTEAPVIKDIMTPLNAEVTSQKTKLGAIDVLEIHVLAEKTSYRVPDGEAALITGPDDYYLCYWSDGAYLYELSYPACISRTQMEEIAQSIRPVEDVTPFLVTPSWENPDWQEQNQQTYDPALVPCAP